MLKVADPCAGVFLYSTAAITRRAIVQRTSGESKRKPSGHHQREMRTLECRVS
jgi:hypothetical protein